MAGSIETEKRLIRAALDEAVAALTDKNWEAYSRFWAHEPYIQVIHPAARDWTSGRDQVALKYKAFIDSPVKVSGSIRRFEVNIAPSGDFAWATYEAAISLDDIEHLSWQVAVFRKRQGLWEAVLGFDAALPEGAGTS
jgi:ketosteroid isomerase-like protein